MENEPRRLQSPPSVEPLAEGCDRRPEAEQTVERRLRFEVNRRLKEWIRKTLRAQVAPFHLRNAPLPVQADRNPAIERKGTHRSIHRSSQERRLAFTMACSSCSRSS